MKLSLRARLSLVVVAVAASALLAGNVAVYALASNFLDQRVDEQLTGLAGPAARIAFSAEHGGPNRDFLSFSDRDGLRGPVSSVDVTGAYVEARGSDGKKIDGRYLLLPENEQRTPPELPDQLDLGGRNSLLLDTVARNGDATIPYRARVTPVTGNAVAVAALPLTDLEATRSRLVLIEALATLGVIGLVAGLTWWLVGLGLRPLERMERTAERIAEGDLSQRVEPAGSGTEIARLGAALNAMLTEIETAFAAKDVSERKLRRFVADASHELRTPLTSIRGYAELLRRGTVTEPGDVSSAAQRIEQEATRLGSLVEDLLLLARLDEGAGVVLSPVDLSVIAGNAVDDARVIDPARSILLDLHGAAIVEGDRNRLAQVVTNLITNARVHTAPGSTVEVRVRAGADGTVAVEVVDHGPGIDPAVAARVFDRFFRADPSRSRDRGGSGLGLAIVAAIVEAHHGRCEVDMTPGGGATFRVVLPQHRPAMPAERDSSADVEVVGTYVSD